MFCSPFHLKLEPGCDCLVDFQQIKMKLLIFSVLLVAVSAFPFGSALQDQVTPSPGYEMSFEDQIRAIERLMIKVIEDVHESEIGFVNHTVIENAGGKIIDLVIEAAKPLKKLIFAVVKDIHICSYKLARAFRQGKTKREIELQAGQCFFVVHRPFVVLLRQVLEKDLIGKYENNDDEKDKRGVRHLMRDLIEIRKLFGRFRDGKLDLPYVIKMLRVIKEGSEFFRDAESLIKTFAGDYIELGIQLLDHIKYNEIKKAQILAGRAYLSFARRMAKVMAILKHSHGGDHHENNRPTRRPFTKYPTGGGYTKYPTGGGYTNYPTGGGYTNYPTGGGYTKYPTGGGYTKYPTSGGYTKYPTGGGYTKYPTGGGYTKYPTGGGYTKYPTSGGQPGFTKKPTSGGQPGFTNKPMTGSGPQADSQANDNLEALLDVFEKK